MNEHAHMHAHARGRNTQPVSLNRLAFSATLHCLTGCAIGEVLGMVIGTATGLDNDSTIALAVVLSFFFGYLLTMLRCCAPVCRSRRRCAPRSPPTPLASCFKRTGSAY